MKALVAWSSGKDSAYALELARRAGEVEVVGLLTTVTEDYARVSMHGVREEVLELQARAAGLPLRRVRIPAGCVNAEYERRMGEAVARARADGVTHVVFGDIFLEEVRATASECWRAPGSRRSSRSGAAKRRHSPARCSMPGSRRRSSVWILAGSRRRSPGASSTPRSSANYRRASTRAARTAEFHTCVTDGPMFATALALPVRRGRASRGVRLRRPHSRRGGAGPRALTHRRGPRRERGAPVEAPRKREAIRRSTGGSGAPQGEPRPANAARAPWRGTSPSDRA
jgi:hypothetical protein